MSTSSVQVDTRPMAPQKRHSLVFWTFDQLGTDMTMELVNDHDPLPLRQQFEAEKPHLFSWTYLESGPEIWRIAITKRRAPHGAGHCCGACGGQG